MQHLCAADATGLRIFVDNTAQNTTLTQDLPRNHLNNLNFQQICVNT